MTPSAALPPADDRYFEDYIPGSVLEIGSIAVDEAEVVAFASRYDPQAIHIDADFAKAGFFGGLIASGWMTCSLCMRLVVLNYLPTKASLGSPGVDEIRWPKPVRPGDVLTGTVFIPETRLSRSKPDRGVVYSHIEMRNQHGETVMTWKSMSLLACRPPA